MKINEAGDPYFVVDPRHEQLKTRTKMIPNMEKERGRKDEWLNAHIDQEMGDRRRTAVSESCDKKLLGSVPRPFTVGGGGDNTQKQSIQSYRQARNQTTKASALFARNSHNSSLQPH